MADISPGITRLRHGLGVHAVAVVGIAGGGDAGLIPDEAVLNVPGQDLRAGRPTRPRPSYMRNNCSPSASHSISRSNTPESGPDPLEQCQRKQMTRQGFVATMLFGVEPGSTVP